MEKEDLSQLKISRTDRPPPFQTGHVKKGGYSVLVILFLLFIGILYWKGVLEPAQRS